MTDLCPRCYLADADAASMLCAECLAELQLEQLRRAYLLALDHRLPGFGRGAAPYFRDRCPVCGQPAAQFAAETGEVFVACSRPDRHGRLCS